MAKASEAVAVPGASRPAVFMILATAALDLMAIGIVMPVQPVFQQ